MGTITIVGLGPGAAGNLSLETMGLLQSGAQVILRTAVHPTVAELEKAGVTFVSCDSYYEEGSSFEEVYDRVVARVLAAAETGDVVYAVPGSPLVAERTVVLLREQAKAQGIKLVIKPSMSFLDLAYVELGIDPIAGLRIIDAQDFGAVADAGQYPLMITQVYSQLVASDLKIALMDALDDEYEIYFLRNLGLPDGECRPIKLYELDWQEHIDHLTSVYVPPLPEGEAVAGLMEFGEDEDVFDSEELEPAEAEEAALKVIDELEEYDAEEIEPEVEIEFYEDYDAEEELPPALDGFDIQPLADVIRTLREPGGCPWDREQNFKSIRSNFIEEVYEYLEAVDAEDTEGMCEELGDVLMQVVFHARMAEEAGLFDLQDVIDNVTDKLIRRHPHVYGEVSVNGSEQVLANWDAIKKEEKQERKHILDGVTKDLPALLRAYKLQSKAAKVGFDWDKPEAVWAKVEEELGELQEALGSGDKEASAKELGDVLFALVNYARKFKIEPEVALDGTNNRFASRFAHVEKCVETSGREWASFSLAELDKFWDEAKALEKQGS